MNCNTRPADVASVVLGFNYETHNAPVYEISSQSDNALLNYLRFSKFSLKEYLSNRRAFIIVFRQICTACAYKSLLLRFKKKF